MEEEAVRPLRRRRPLSDEEGTALVVVLMAIVILLPPTLVLATLALRWQRQSIDLRDTLTEELAARAALDEARARMVVGAIEIEANQSGSFVPQPIEGVETEVRVSRFEDVVLSGDGRILEGVDAGALDLDRTGTDSEGHVVYLYRRLEVYLVDVRASRRPSLAPVRLYGVLARLPDGSVKVLGVTLGRRFEASTPSAEASSKP